MGVMEDTVGEFKKAGPTEKFLIIGASVAVLGIALYLHSKSQGQGATGTGGPAAPTSGWGTVGPNQTPILPGGYQPIYDPNGNLVGYGPIPTPAPTPTPTPTPTPKPPPKPKKPPKDDDKDKDKDKPKHRPRPHGNPPPIIKRRDVDVIVRHQPTHVATTASRQVHR